MAEFGGQLEPRHYGFSPEIQVDQDGVKWAVTTDDIPASASDFAACTRSALSDMPVSADLIRKGAEELNVQRTQASAAQRSLMGSPVVIVVAGVTIIVSELVLEAGAITILFAVTVKVVEKAVDDVAELAKRRRPRSPKDRCLDAAAGGEYLWKAFCRSIPDPQERERCWSLAEGESEEEKRNLCNRYFGN